MGILSILINFLWRLAGIVLMLFSVYYGIHHEASEVRWGIFHVPSLYFVGLGLVGITIASYRIEVLFRLFWNSMFMSPAFQSRLFANVDKVIVSLTETYYDKGPAALVTEVSRHSLPKLWRYIADRLEARMPIDDIRHLIEHQAASFNEGLFVQIRILQGIATIAPAVGMTGTIFGLINLLKDLQDFSKLGSNMALAFITALYGLVFGNFIFIPIVNRLNAGREEIMNQISQGLLWLDMIAQRKPATYLDSSENRKIA